MRLMPLFTLCLAVALTACSQFPALDDAVDEDLRNGEYPELVPLAQLEVAARSGRITPQTASGMEGRIARLQARAAGLRGTVLDAPSRERLAQTVE